MVVDNVMTKAVMMVVAKNPKSGRGFSHTKEIEFSAID